jgi:hypothetical protein
MQTLRCRLVSKKKACSKAMKKGGFEMSWIQKLYETYNNCQSMVGVESNGNEVPLVPISHTTQKAQVEIVIDGNGNFRRARVIPKDEARTIIPCTEKSGGRTSGEACFCQMKNRPL